MEEIYKKFCVKTGEDINKLDFLFYGNKINKNLTLDQHNIMYIKVVNDIKENENDKKSKENDSLKVSKFPICPKCGKKSIINFNDYKIRLYDCKNLHNIDNIPFFEYKKTQTIEESKIICHACKEKNKSNSNEFFICSQCNINLCPKCKMEHDKNHNIIDYERKDYIYQIHNEPYSQYCHACKLNICLECERNHENHSTLSFGKLILHKDVWKNLVEN